MSTIFCVELPSSSRELSVKMVNEEQLIKKKGPKNLKKPSPPQKSKEVVQNGERKETLFSPRFRSVAEMAGWDEEALMIASLIVEDTPDRISKQKKRPRFHNFETPPTSSTRKRRAQRNSPPSIMPVVVLDLEDNDEPPKEQVTNKEMKESKFAENEKKKTSENESDAQGSTVSSSSAAIPCIDRLREELSCAICLEICFEPSTTPCGHSFCKKCLRSAADKCGKKCPKCRQLIRSSCTVNTVLWNTIQLLFPQEVEARKAACALNSQESQRQSPARFNTNAMNVRNRTVEALNNPESGNLSPRTRRSYQSTRRQSNVRPSRILRRNELPSQDEDAALALRLPREEFLGAFRGSEYRSSLAMARANLQAMASRAIRVRGL
ncbi:hypothetical protein ACH5RR_010997 [Cinchona calisaya]|uniref:RING-type E3 ubiquitin transferase n=1 Tax=Cinchona calisaya TaxID=153742 RepID=A0ABD3A3L7_9GENT